MIKFTRFETENNNSFTFLGYEYRWGLSRVGKPLVMMRTSKKKFRAALAAILSWIKKERSNLGTPALLKKLSQKLQGHCNYYGVRGNYAMLYKFYRLACLTVFKWLDRRRKRKAVIGRASRKCYPISRYLVPELSDIGNNFALVRGEQY